MQHDVRRLDRLITDISDASRLDAELARGEASPVDLAALLRMVVSMLAESPRNNGTSRRALRFRAPGQAHERRSISCWDTIRGSRRLITNLIDNACSFSEPGGVVRVALERKTVTPADGGAPEEVVAVTVDDDGPGIPPHALERVFERFYTDRPNQGFRPEFGSRPFDFAADRRGASRPDLGRRIVRWRRRASRRTYPRPLGRMSRSAMARAPASSSNCRPSPGERRQKAAGRPRNRRRLRGVGRHHPWTFGLRQERAGARASCARARFRRLWRADRRRQGLARDAAWTPDCAGRQAYGGSDRTALRRYRNGALRARARSSGSRSNSAIPQSLLRFPKTPDLWTVQGIATPRLALDRGGSAADNALAVEERLRSMAQAGG